MPFGSREFKDFAREWGIKTTTSSPSYAQSNGQAESRMVCANYQGTVQENGRERS